MGADPGSGQTGPHRRHDARFQHSSEKRGAPGRPQEDSRYPRYAADDRRALRRTPRGSAAFSLSLDRVRVPEGVSRPPEEGEIADESDLSGIRRPEHFVTESDASGGNDRPNQAVG